MKNGYFHRVQAETPTRFWVNNPTINESVLAIEAGAEYCTTNPTYAAKMLRHPEMKAIGKTLLAKAVKDFSDDSLAAACVQRNIVRQIMPVFMDIYRKSEGTKGWVSIQGDPEKEDDPEEILREAELGLKLEKNYIAKVPVTGSGIAAIRTLSSDNVPVIATEIMSLSQAVNICEVYSEAVRGKNNPAPIYVTHITGIFDQQLGEWKKKSGADITDEVLWYAGLLAGRKQYRILKERKYPVTILGGGARGLHHFTEFVGADMHITINLSGTADRLIESNPPVENKFDKPVSGKIVEELLEKVPTFKAAWEEDGLSVDEYADFPPVALFRSMFLEGWHKLLTEVKEYRSESQI
jgi:transaldolase